MTSQRQTTAERVADVLRRQITEGVLMPGTQLSEEHLVTQLAVSRNTLREAFRLLTHDGLLVHRLHRGVFVAELSDTDLVDLYRLRRLIECEVVRSLRQVDAETLTPLRREVEAAESAAWRGLWSEVGTANMRFHQSLVGLAGSPRMDEVARRLLAEVRLVFHVVASPKELHEEYVRLNRQLYELIASGDIARASEALERYLDQSERQLLAAYRGRSGASGGLSAVGG